ncbi:MAG TPA: outer membrane beta-barrel protein [Thermoanaerobaculia bacterium]|jgi:hypothetical protein|nr:outer membrane beta-barrel protein [Thermoanaerobaculia bacterium]
MHPIVVMAVISGFIDFNVALNPNRPQNHENFIPGTGTTAKRANEFSLNLAQVQWTRPASAEEPLGFTLALAAGEGEDVVHAAEDLRHVYQASVAWCLPNGVVLEGGIYPSHIGMESFYSKDNWNYTRSWMGEFTPYYQTGVKASYAFNERWSGQVHLLNGWQNIRDNDDGKAIGTQIAYSKGPFSASLNTYFDQSRKFADVVAIYKVSDRLQLGATVDIADDDIEDWHAVGVYGRLAANDRHAVAVRAEHFSTQELQEITVTYEHRPRRNLILKLEGRYDRSDADVFFDEENRQFLAIAGAVVTF